MSFWRPKKKSYGPPYQPVVNDISLRSAGVVGIVDDVTIAAIKFAVLVDRHRRQIKIDDSKHFLLSRAIVHHSALSRQFRLLVKRTRIENGLLHFGHFANFSNNLKIPNNLKIYLKI